MKAKLGAILLILIVVQTITNAQESKNDDQKSFSVGITYSNFGDAIVSGDDDLIGSASTSIDHFSGFGIVGTYQAKKWLEFETGLVFTKYFLIMHSAPTPEVYISKHHTSIFSLPIIARINFLKYFFINGGLMVEFDGKRASIIHEQSGIAVTAGIGVRYEFDSGLSIYLNPYLTEHAIVPFMGGEYRDRIFESAIRFGIAYRIQVVK